MYKRHIGSFLLFLSLGVLLCWGGVWTWAYLMPKPRLIPPSITWSQRTKDRHGQLLHLSLSHDGYYRLPLKREEISSQALEAILRYEDRFFYQHNGVNPFSLIRAAWYSFTGPRLIGASTITMQLARRVQNLHTRSWKGKLAQILWAIRYEAHYEKDDILTAYLSLTPYGGNVEGLKAASLIYFHKDPTALSTAQAIALSVVPQNPIKRHPVTGPDFEKARQNAIQHAITEGLLPQRYQVFTKNTLPIFRTQDLPFLAPHFTRLVESQNEGPQLRTTLDYPLQRKVEHFLKNHVARLQPYGIENGATLVLDSRTMQVLAHVGSANFFHPSYSGEVDGTQALRSPGSTLKPFLYALALDQGLIHSESILLDAPKNFLGYIPSNADQRYRGPIHASDALNESRNIPAVRLANKVQPDLYDLLQKAQAQLPYPREHYGLSLILGGAEVRMEKIARLYASLFQGGLLRPLHRIQGEAPSQQIQLFSPQAAWIIRQMLIKGGQSLALHGQNYPIFWKTGTSNGFRDAWTAGAAGHYIIVVWLGNFNGRPNPWLQGANVAQPLFLRIAQHLLRSPQWAPRMRDQKWWELEPRFVTQENVCTRTGDLQTTTTGRIRCQETMPAWFIPGVSPIRDTGIIKEILFDEKTGLRACRMNEGVKKIFFTDWPPLFRQYFIATGTYKAPLPDWSPECLSQFPHASPAPIILRPHEGIDYFTGTAQKKKACILLEASTSSQSHFLYWFANDRFLGATPVGETLLWRAKPGDYTISCSDENGRRSSRFIRVRQP